MTHLINIPHLLPDDYDRLAILNYIPTAIEESGITDELLTDIALCSPEIAERLSAVIEKEKGNPLTPDVHSAHKSRLDHLKNIRKGLYYYIGHEEQERVDAAERLLTLYNKYLQNLPNRKRVTYTGAIDGFLHSLTEINAVDLQEKIDMTQKFTLLAQSQDSFVELTKERVRVEERDTTPVTQSTRDEMHCLYDTLLQHLIYKQYRAVPLYEELTEKLNTRISEIIAASKNSHRHDLPEETPEEPIPDDDSFTHQGDR